MKRKKAPLREAFFHLDEKNNVWRETVRFQSVSPMRSYDKQTSVYNEEDTSIRWDIWFFNIITCSMDENDDRS